MMARSGGGMKVAGPDVAQAAASCCDADGRDGHAATATEIIVRDRSGEQIGRVIAANQIVISELAPIGSSLEEIYFELTDSDREARHDPRSSAPRSSSCARTRTFYGLVRRRARPRAA